MILDKGTVTIFEVSDAAEPGNMPVSAYIVKAQSWYGELRFVAGKAYRTDMREDVEVDARIRILQDRRITNHDVLVFGLHNAPCGVIYEIIRAFHGVDDENGQPITDLSLKVVRP